jgi:16S rRNA G527 N7-methylase RsmG
MTEKEAAGEELSLNVSFFTERGFARMKGIVELCKTWLANSGIPPGPSLPTSVLAMNII